MRPAAVTAVGGWPGTDVRAVAAIVEEQCADLVHLPELPERGPSSDMVGRTMTWVSAVATDFAVATVPGGWRLTAGRGRDMRRGDGYWSEDLDVLEEVFAGYSGDLKVQLVGPWTLAASVEDKAGERLLRDLGAVRELAAALRDGWLTLVADVARRLPGARVLAQIDEPLLADVLAGAVPTQSTWTTYDPIDRDVAVRVLAQVRSAHSGLAALHCCAADYPFDVARCAGFQGVSFDVARVGRPARVALGEQLDVGGFAMLGIAPSTVAAGREAVLRLGSDVGYSAAQWASHIVLTPPCDLLDMPLSAARGRMALLRNVAAALEDGE